MGQDIPRLRFKGLTSNRERQRDWPRPYGEQYVLELSSRIRLVGCHDIDLPMGAGRTSLDAPEASYQVHAGQLAGLTVIVTMCSGPAGSSRARRITRSSPGGGNFA